MKYSSSRWLVQYSRDPADELAWLEEQLSKAEAEGELVHLLGHVPPGILATERSWSREYTRIIVRLVSHGVDIVDTDDGSCLKANWVM